MTVTVSGVPVRAATPHPLAGERPEAWERSAACTREDITLFFGPVEPEDRRAREEREERAKRVCARCPVVDPCRRAALARGERFGVWGGLGERERRRLLRRVAR